jgi:guanylate kinase
MNNLSIVISAPSGAGKTTLIAELLKADERLEFSVSTTTRPRREGEIDGLSYNFVDMDTFRKMIEEDNFIEWANVHGNYYGTTKKEVDRIQGAGKILIFDVDVQGARLLREKWESIYIFIVPPNREVLISRLHKRKTDSESQIQVRLQTALSELTQYYLYDYIVVNNDIELALNQFKSIITAELCRQHRNLNIISDILEEWRDNPAG